MNDTTQGCAAHGRRDCEECYLAALTGDERCAHAACPACSGAFAALAAERDRLQELADELNRSARGRVEWANAAQRIADRGGREQ